MTKAPAAWTATLTVRSSDGALADWIERALRPEVAREVPRAHARLRRTPAGELEVEIAARDTGSMRAALNTFLGWVQLSAETARSARGSDPGSRRSTAGRS